jgi:cbb3-type cytochrome oxidase subunit 3
MLTDSEFIAGIISILIFSWCIGVYVYEARRRGRRYYNAMVYKAYAEAAINTKTEVIDTCPHCGTTEMLCGHNGPGCTVKEEENENI